LKQPAYPAGSHDSIQYHFFCEDKLFAMRIFRSDSLEQTSAWIFDGTAKAVLASDSKITQSDAGHLDVSSQEMTLAAGEDAGRITIVSEKAEGSFEVEFTLGKTLNWGYNAQDVGEDVFHQPDLACVVTYRGKKMVGRGYCKRYYWQNPPRYWGYRFLQGFIDDRKTSIWTADAMFGTSKYEYFKLLGQDGTLLELPTDTCAHKQNLMFGYLDGVRHEAIFEELGAWNQTLKSSSMDSHMQQRYGKVTYFDGNNVRTGVAITEYCFGTLG
jgi:hypothetical protein